MLRNLEEREIAANAINRQISVRLAAFIASKGISRAMLAANLATSPLKITRFESGNSEMTAAELVLFAKALGITSSVLTGEEPFTDTGRQL